MQRLPPFSYEPARSVAEAVALLSKYGADAMPVSGGTDLYANMKQRLFAPKVLVGLRPIRALRFIAYDDARGLEIGALATVRDLAESEIVAARYPALARAASSISTPQLRAMGTVGGNLCLDTRCNYYNQNLDWRAALGFCLKNGADICRVAAGSRTCLAVNASDLAPVLQAFGAAVHLAGSGGERALDIAQFFTDDGRNALARDAREILVKIALPPAQPGTRSAYRKLRQRASFDFPLLGVASVVWLDGAGVCRDARVVLNALGPRPVEALEAAQCLIGTRLEPEALAIAADAAYKVGKPMENAGTTLAYRKRMLRVFTRRTLEDIAGVGAPA